MFGYIGNVYQLNFNIITSMEKPSESKEDGEKFIEEMRNSLKELTDAQQIQIIKFEKDDEWAEDDMVVNIDMQIVSNSAVQMNNIKRILLENENKTLPDGKNAYLVSFNGNEDDGQKFDYDKNLSYFEFAFQYKFTQKFQSKLELLNLSMSELYELINYWFKKATPELFCADNNTLPAIESIDEYLNEWQHFIRNELHFQYVHMCTDGNPNNM